MTTAGDRVKRTIALVPFDQSPVNEILRDVFKNYCLRFLTSFGSAGCFVLQFAVCGKDLQT